VLKGLLFLFLLEEGAYFKNFQISRNYQFSNVFPAKACRHKNLMLLFLVILAHSYLWQLTENWETGVQYPVWAKSLTPGFALINHFYEMIISVAIDLTVQRLD